MQTPIKFVFKVKCRSGVIVSDLKINGMDLDHARSRLEQMYPKCTLLAYHALDIYGRPLSVKASNASRQSPGPLPKSKK